jgi:hypothetical protein
LPVSGLERTSRHALRDQDLEPVVAEVAGYRDAGVDLIIVNLPHHAKPDSLQPLAEALTSLG